jgi:hypothetical protein
MQRFITRWLGGTLSWRQVDFDCDNHWITKESNKRSSPGSCLSWILTPRNVRFSVKFHHEPLHILRRGSVQQCPQFNSFRNSTVTFCGSMRRCSQIARASIFLDFVVSRHGTFLTGRRNDPKRAPVVHRQPAFAFRAHCLRVVGKRSLEYFSKAERLAASSTCV